MTHEEGQQYLEETTPMKAKRSEQQFSIVAQIAEVERELMMRNKVYPNQVARGAMKQAEADYHIGRLEAVLRTLKWLQKNEARIKERVGT